MSLDQLTLRRGIRTVSIGLLCVVALTAVGNASPIDIEIITPRTKLDPLNIVNHISRGSGIVINKDAVLTAFHNIEFPVKGAGTWATGVKVLAYFPKKDICVIKYPTEGQKFSRLAPNPPKVGDRVVLYGRHGTYSGTWQENPHYDDQMSVKFDGRRPKIGDSGGGVFTEQGLVGIFLGYSGWIDGPKGEYSRIATWTTLKAFGIPTSAPVTPKTDELLPLPGTEHGKTPPKGRDSTKEEVSAEKPVKEPEKEVNHGTGHTSGRSTETDNEDSHVGTPDGQSKGRRISIVHDPGQRSGSGDEKSRNLETGTLPEPHAGKGSSLPPTPPKKGSGSSNMLEMLITAALGVAGITVTGGTAVLVYGGVRGGLALYRRRKKRKPDTGINTLKDQIKEVLGQRPDGFRSPHIPGRKVDEIGELLQLAELEGYDPLMGSTFGLFMQDEINQLLAGKASEEQKDIVRKLYNSTMDRLNSAAPLVKGQ